MKKCPVCEKTFDDSMRFCQTDGTALVDDVVEEIPEDPYKTMVARPEDDFAAAIPPSNDDPFKTMVAGSKPVEESGDLLQLPEEYDAMKTSVVSQSERDELGLNDIQDEPVNDAAPLSPFGSPDSPFESKPDESPGVFSQTPPDPPKFDEPNLNPPDFNDMSSSGASESATEMFPPDSIPPKDNWGNSPFSQPNEAPIPSPFGDAPQSSYEKPSAPIPPYKEQEPPTVMGANPFDQPPSFGQQDPFNQPFNQPVQQNNWSPPPSPVASWQDQGLGANTPFQPPAAGTGQETTLAIVSLALGIGSFLCLGIIMAIPAVITGYMQRNNIKSDPARYGGGGMALAGMILGAANIVLTILFVILYAILIMANL